MRHTIAFPTLLLALLAACGGGGVAEHEEGTGLLVTNGATGPSATPVVAISIGDERGMVETWIGAGDTIFIPLAPGGVYQVTYIRGGGGTVYDGGEYYASPGETIEVTWG